MATFQYLLTWLITWEAGTNLRYQLISIQIMTPSDIGVLNRKQQGMPCAHTTKCMAPYMDYKVQSKALGTCGAHTVDDMPADTMHYNSDPWDGNSNYTCVRNKASVHKDEQHDDDAGSFQMIEDSGW